MGFIPFFLFTSYWLPKVFSIEVMYVPPMTLGRSFDVSSDNIGTELFPLSETTSPKNLHVIPFDTVKIDTRVVKTAKDVRNLLSVSGRMSLKLKMGLLDIRGYGSYLKDSTNKENTVEVVVKVRYQTEVRTLTSDARPYPRWYERQNVVGKHYVRALTYGGELLARMKFVTTDNNKKEDIQAVLSAGISIGGGGILDAKVEGHFKQAMRYASSRSNIHIKIFSTEKMEESPEDIDSFLRIIEDFPNQVKRNGDGKGHPIRAEVSKLSTLDKTKSLLTFSYKNDRLLQTRLDDFEEMYDDILATNSAIENWLKAKTCVCDRQVSEAWRTDVVCVPKEMSEQLGELYRDITVINRAMVKFMTSFSSNSFDKEQVERETKAVENVYYQNSIRAPVRFIRRFRQILGEQPKSALSSELKGLCNFLLATVDSYSEKEINFMKQTKLLLEIKEINTVATLLRVSKYMSDVFTLGGQQTNFLVRTSKPQSDILKFDAPFCPVWSAPCKPVRELYSYSKRKGLCIASSQLSKPINMKSLIWRIKSTTYKSEYYVTTSKCGANGGKLPASQTILLEKMPNDRLHYYTSSGTITEGESQTFVSLIQLIDLSGLEKLKEAMKYF